MDRRHAPLAAEDEVRGEADELERLLLPRDGAPRLRLLLAPLDLPDREPAADLVAAAPLARDLEARREFGEGRALGVEVVARRERLALARAERDVEAVDPSAGADLDQAAVTPALLG